MITPEIIEAAANGKLTSSLIDILNQHGENKMKPPEGEYWVVVKGEVILKTADADKADSCAMDKGGISIRPEGESFYIFGTL